MYIDIYPYVFIYLFFNLLVILCEHASGCTLVSDNGVVRGGACPDRELVCLVLD